MIRDSGDARIRQEALLRRIRDEVGHKLIKLAKKISVKNLFNAQPAFAVA